MEGRFRERNRTKLSNDESLDPTLDLAAAAMANGSIAVDTVFEGKRKISPTTRTRTVLIPDIMMLEREAALKPAR